MFVRGYASHSRKSRVYGQPYKVPEVRVWLTDEETGGPFADRKAFAKYCWGWDVIKRTAEADRMPFTECMEIEIRTDEAGAVALPSVEIKPSRPIPPPGAEFSAPRFKYAGIVVRDEKHNTYMSVFDVEVNLLDDKGEVHRTVMLLERPKKP